MVCPFHSIHPGGPLRFAEWPPPPRYCIVSFKLRISGVPVKPSFNGKISSRFLGNNIATFKEYLLILIPEGWARGPANENVLLLHTDVAKPLCLYSRRLRMCGVAVKVPKTVQTFPFLVWFHRNVLLRNGLPVNERTKHLASINCGLA